MIFAAYGEGFAVYETIFVTRQANFAAVNGDLRWPKAVFDARERLTGRFRATAERRRQAGCKISYKFFFIIRPKY
jgi:hypothetical protein